MATIQIREIPSEAYEVIARRAKAGGQSIQQYMRQYVIDFAFTPTKEELKSAIEANQANFPLFATTEEILEAIDEGRR